MQMYLKYCDIKIYYLQRSRASFVEDENIQKTIRKASFIAATSTAVNAVDDSKALLDEVIKSCHWLLPIVTVVSLTVMNTTITTVTDFSLIVADFSLYVHRLVTVLLPTYHSVLSPTCHVTVLSRLVTDFCRLVTVFPPTCHCTALTCRLLLLTCYCFVIDCHHLVTNCCRLVVIITSIINDSIL